MDEIEKAELLEFLTKETQGAVRATDQPRVMEILDDRQTEGVPVVAKVYGDAGMVPIFDIKTGEQSMTSVNMLVAQLTKIGPDGERMFTRIQPTTLPARGQHKCMLHPDDVDRPLYQEWGLGTCPKSNLPSSFMVEQHMQKCHKVAWQTIKRYRDEQKEQREQRRREQHERDLVAALAGRAVTHESEAVRGKRAAS